MKSMILIAMSILVPSLVSAESGANCLIREGQEVTGSHGESGFATLEDSIYFTEFSICVDLAKARLGGVRTGPFVFTRGRRDRYHRGRRIHDASAQFRTTRVVAHFQDERTQQHFVVRMKVE